MSHGAVNAPVDQKTHKKPTTSPGPGPPSPPGRGSAAQHAARSSRAEPDARSLAPALIISAAASRTRSR